MLKRLLILVAAAASLAISGCCCGSKCYVKSWERSGRQMVDFVDVYFLNYDKHDPYRCDPCVGD